MNQVATRVGEDASPHGEAWREVLKQYGEHLTEEELKIIREQLG